MVFKEGFCCTDSIDVLLPQSLQFGVIMFSVFLYVWCVHVCMGM